jgi:hypothetical protein
VSWPDRRPIARKIPAESEWHQNLINDKVEKLIRRRYLRVPESGTKVHVSIPYMAVKKTDLDVRVVWSCTENGVNPSIYVPRMFMPTGDTMIWKIPPGGWAGDLDSAEMFNNYQMHPTELLLNGVEISEALKKSLGLSTNMLVWDRLLFGWRPAPLYAERMFLRAIEASKRSRYDTSSAFAWCFVRLNLPSSNEYNPGLPCVAKMREDG